jgi:DNA-directed RNA polymerase subunit RPC12/RpoP
MDDVWYRCAVCGAISDESEVQREDGPLACPVCGSQWVEECEEEDDDDDEPEAAQG